VPATSQPEFLQADSALAALLRDSNPGQPLPILPPVYGAQPFVTSLNQLLYEWPGAEDAGVRLDWLPDAPHCLDLGPTAE